MDIQKELKKGFKPKQIVSRLLHATKIRKLSLNEIFYLEAYIVGLESNLNFYKHGPKKEWQVSKKEKPCPYNPSCETYSDEGVELKCKKCTKTF